MHGLNLIKGTTSGTRYRKLLMFATRFDKYSKGWKFTGNFQPSKILACQ
jgi:hypothetical protein